MLAYAYQNLEQRNYANIETEDFDNIQDLFAAIIAQGIALLLKQGLRKEYIENSDSLSTLRGKIDLKSSINLMTQRCNQLICTYDELSPNSYMNQIVKTTAMYLIASEQVKPQNKSALKKVMLYFSDIDIVEPTTIQWNSIRFHKYNKTYRMLINICHLILKVLLLTTDSGKQRLETFLDTQTMSRLYEKFILEYYRKHHPELQPNPTQIFWDLDDDNCYLLPTMQTDIELKYGKKTLIIDAKYYSSSLQTFYGSYTIPSANLYQIFTYVKNRDTEKSGDVSGMLLYAKTDEDITPNQDYLMSGNRISVRSLDLNRSFLFIKEALNNIAIQLMS